MISLLLIYLLDTTAVSDAVAGHPVLRARVAKAAAAAADRVVVCSITRGEVLFGVEVLPAGKRQNELRAKVNGVLNSMPCEPVAPAAADHYARVKRARQAKGLSMDENDLWIAATALALGAVLVTRDKDFHNVPGLTVEDWTV